MWLKISSFMIWLLRKDLHEFQPLARRKTGPVKELEQLGVLACDHRLDVLDLQRLQVEEQLREQGGADAAAGELRVHAEGVDHRDRLGAAENAEGGIAT